jgi:MFS family permease
LNQLRRPQYILPIIIVSQFAGTSLWFAGNAVLGELRENFHLDKHAVSNLTSTVQFGFIAGTFVFAFLSIADRFSPSKVFFVSSIVAALANITIISIHDANLLFVLRFVTGFFLAGIYPVGMKIAADWYDKELGKALGFLVGALVLGTAFPHLLKGNFSLPWKEIIIVTSCFAALGGLLVLLLVHDGPFRKKGTGVHPSALLSTFRNVPFRSAAFGYFGHMWELYTFWAFLPMIVSMHNNSSDLSLNVPLTSFASIAAGAVGCIVGGWISRVWGSARVAFYSLFTSWCCCLISSWLIPSASIFFIPFIIIWGISVAADSPQFSALVANTAPAAQKGTALTFVICIGFAITIFSIYFIDQIIAKLNSPNNAFTFLAFGPAIGLIAMLPLLRRTNEKISNDVKQKR